MADATWLNVLLFLPVAGAALLLAVPTERGNAIRGLTLVVMLAQFVIATFLYVGFDAKTPGLQFATLVPWIPAWGVAYSVGLDGYNILLVLLTAFLGPLTVAGAFTAIRKDVKLFYVMVLLIQFAMMGAFVAQDLFLFYLFWEAMMIPMFLIIGIWGGERRIYATIKFVLYTAFGSILMLAALIYLAYSVAGPGGEMSFAFTDLYQARLPLSVQILLLSAFGLSFAIKVPLVPLHTWLPDAHVEAPTAGSVILAGILLKMGTYGFMKLGFPLFPDATHWMMPFLITLSVVSIIYGACLALVQDDIKKIIAYSSISHLGYVMLGLVSLDLIGVQGAIVQMVSHGLTAAGLFLLVGMIYERCHTRDLARVRRAGEAAAGVRGVLHAADAGVDRPADDERVHRRVHGAARRGHGGLAAVRAGQRVPAGHERRRRVRRRAGRALHAAVRAGLPVRRGEGAARAGRRPRPAREADPGRDHRRDLRAGPLPQRAAVQD